MNLYEEVLRQQRSGHPCALCTIVRTIGSSPRPPGSMLLLKDSGAQVGSVSGGCVEEELLDAIVAGTYPDDRPSLVEYGVSAEENER